MAKEQSRQQYPGQSRVYQIRIRGHLNLQWTAWFDRLTIKLEENGDTLLTGPVIDQAALHGILKKVRDLGMPLLSVNPVDADQANLAENRPSSDAPKAADND